MYLYKNEHTAPHDHQLFRRRSSGVCMFRASLAVAPLLHPLDLERASERERERSRERERESEREIEIEREGGQ